MKSMIGDHRSSTMVDMDTIGDRLRSTRLAAGLTQGALGSDAGVSKQAISAIESGATKNPEAKTLEPIARRLGVSQRWLLTGRGGSEGATPEVPAEDGPLSPEEAEMLALFRSISPEMRAALVASAQASLAPPSRQATADLVRRVNPKHRERLKAMGMLPDATSETKTGQPQPRADQLSSKKRRD